MSVIDQGDEAPFPECAPPMKEGEELDEQSQDKQNALKQEAADALEDGKTDLALQKMTEAICVGCPSALMYSRRAQILFQEGRPRAAVNDCTAALAINPDSGKAFKIRAKAYAKLEMWLEAHSDFQTGLKIDYDEATEEASLEVAAKAKDIKAAGVQARLKDEQEAYQKKLQADKEAYEAGLKAREHEWKEKEEAEKAEKERKEQERRDRVRARENAEKEGEAASGDTDGAPTSHGPQSYGPPPTATGGGCEDVD
eukprot:gnl/TRDRNA2_/TRDRNA2_182945_c0_seq1.p1 gnl/TRDRNA2_/TRDRNA2_182945_c0~~gnl/TRDRNA2_/TRDRNA2_182945_c0_seq1.p1  ORF type:complete len:255 (+),score=81.66 gnl/TRDRNA2_/TRDRNA2_182945_c0_seq1:66-830(+)